MVPSEPPLRPEYEAAGVTVHIVAMARLSTSHGPRAWLAYLLGWPVAVARLTRLVRSLGVDVVHSNSLHSLYGWAVAILTRRPHVWHAREIVVQSSAALRLERGLARRSTRVVAVSRAVAAQLDARNVVVIHDVPDPAEFSPTLAGTFRSAEGIPDDAPVVGAAGRIDTWKGFDVVLDAFALVYEQLPAAHLVLAGGVVAGKEQYAADLAVRTRAQPGAHWLGPRTDLPDVLADLDVCVMASTEPEPYGLVAVEALASGVPVVMTDRGGPLDIAADATPGAARLVAPGDAAQLAAAIVATVADHGPTTSATRRARTALTPVEPPAFAELFATVVAHRAGGPVR